MEPITPIYAAVQREGIVMENIYLFAGHHAWIAGTLVVTAVAGTGVRRYGQLLERRTREQGAQRPRSVID